MDLRMHSENVTRSEANGRHVKSISVHDNGSDFFSSLAEQSETGCHVPQVADLISFAAYAVIPRKVWTVVGQRLCRQRSQLQNLQQLTTSL